jgi:hypothetical protein
MKLKKEILSLFLPHFVLVALVGVQMLDFVYDIFPFVFSKDGSATVTSDSYNDRLLYICFGGYKPVVTKINATSSAIRCSGNNKEYIFKCLQDRKLGSDSPKIDPIGEKNIWGQYPKWWVYMSCG